MNDEKLMMNDEWWMINDERWMINDQWWMMNNEWSMINHKCKMNKKDKNHHQNWLFFTLFIDWMLKFCSRIDKREILQKMNEPLIPSKWTIGKQHILVKEEMTNQPFSEWTTVRRQSRTEE